VSHLPDPKDALVALRKHCEGRSARGQRELNLGDPEDVVEGLQDTYNLSYSDADELFCDVWELM
jgi:hypothetical protein